MSVDLVRHALSSEPVGGRDIYPPESYSPWWWLVVVGCLLGIVAVVWWARRVLGALEDASSAADDLAQLRREAHEQIDAIESRARQGHVAAPDAFSRLSAVVRRFAGIATNGDADYRVAEELRRDAETDPRLEPVAGLVDDLLGGAFAPPGSSSSDPDLATACSRAREVIDGWA